MSTLNEHTFSLRTPKFCLCIILAVSYFLLQGCVVFAAETAVFESLQTCEIDSTTDVFLSGIRTVGFGILKLLGRATDTLYDSLTYIFQSIDITYSSGVGALIKKYSYLYKLLFTISMAVFGLYLIAKTNTGQLNTLNCIMLIFLVVAAMPLLTEKLAKLTDAGSTYVQSQWTSNAAAMDVESLSGSIMKDYIIDLQKVDDQITENNIGTLKKAVDKKTGYNYFTDGGKDWRYIDINEPMDYNENTYKNNFWDKKLESIDGKKTLSDMSSWLPYMDKFYYRYQMTSWFEPMLLMLVVCVVFLFSGFRCATLIVEIIQAEIYLPFVAVSDLATGQRIKEGIKQFFVLFAGIFLCIALFGIYFICYKWINVNVDNTIATIVFQLALAWAVINGPNAIERILGVDVGVKDGWKILLGLNAAKATGAASMAAVASAGKAMSAPVRAAKWGMDKKEQAHSAMEQHKQKQAEMKKETDKWKSSGTESKDSMSDLHKSQAERFGNSDPMASKDKNVEGMADQSSSKGTADQNISKDMPGTSDPMSQRNSRTEDVKAGQDPMQHKTSMNNGVHQEPDINHGDMHGHKNNPAGKQNISESRPAFLDGKPIDVRKGK